MFGFLLLAFLLLCVVLAVAVFFAFKSGEQGKTKLSGFAGCAIALALVVIAGMGAVGTLVVAVFSAPAELARRGPVKGFELHYDHDRIDPERLDSADRDRPLRVRIELRGTTETQSVMRWIRKNTDEHTTISVHDEHDAGGGAFTVIEITPRLDEHDRDELEDVIRDLKRELPELVIPYGGRVEIKGPDDD